MDIIAVWFQLVGRTIAALWRWARHEPLAAGILFATMPGVGPVRLFTPLRVGGDVLDWAWAVLAASWAWAGVTGEPLHLTAWVKHDIGRARQMIGGASVAPAATAPSASPLATAAPGAPPAIPPRAQGPAITWTGARRTARDELAVNLTRIRALAGDLKANIVGQDAAMQAIGDAILQKFAGVSESRRAPRLSVLAAGPTGVGKTQTAKTLAALLDREYIPYDMTTFPDMHNVAALIGAPPGYMGSDRPGRLVADIAAHPTALLLFDEIEKAHPKIFDAFLAMLDTGQVTELSQRLTADCTQTIVFMTCNLLQNEAAQHPNATSAEVRQMLLAARSSIQDSRVTGGLRAEFVNRIDLVLLYQPLTRDTMAMVAQNYLHTYVRDVLHQQALSVPVALDQAVIDRLLDKCDLAFGVRDLKRAVQEQVGNALTEAYLPWLTSKQRPVALEIALKEGRVLATYKTAEERST